MHIEETLLHQFVFLKKRVTKWFLKTDKCRIFIDIVNKQFSKITLNLVQERLKKVSHQQTWQLYLFEPPSLQLLATLKL